MNLIIWLSIFPIITSTLNSTSNAKQIEISNNKLNNVIDNFNNLALSSKQDDYEGIYKSKIISFYENYNDNILKENLSDLKHFLINNDKYFLQDNSRMISTRLNLTYDESIGHSYYIPEYDSSFFDLFIDPNPNPGIYYEYTMDNAPYIGLNFTKETTISFYNEIATICNNYEDAESLIKAVKNCIQYSFPVFYAGIQEQLISFSKKLVKAFPNTKTGIALKILLYVVEGAIILFFAAIFWFGLREKGFYIGFFKMSNHPSRWEYKMGFYE